MEVRSLSRSKLRCISLGWLVVKEAFVYIGVLVISWLTLGLSTG